MLHLLQLQQPSKPNFKDSSKCSSKKRSRDSSASKLIWSIACKCSKCLISRTPVTTVTTATRCSRCSSTLLMRRERPITLLRES